MLMVPSDISDNALPQSKSSPVRVCFTGRNRAGSWEVRGNQIGARRSNWRASQVVDPADIEKFDLFCFVKRPIPKLMKRLHEAGKPIVFDVVDSWAQPDDNIACHNQADARKLFQAKWDEWPPFHSMIFANRAMFQHLSRLCRHATYIYHHYNPHHPENPLRKDVQTVGYEGNESYLGEWREIIEELCAKRGLKFVVNPEDFGEIDIGFVTRGREHSAFLTNSYKSNVKLANFYGAGTPCIMNATERSYHETDQGDVMFFNTAQQLERQLDRLLPYERRQLIHERFLAKAEEFQIDRIADIFEHYFINVVRLHRQGRLA